MSEPWSLTIRLPDPGTAAITHHLEPDEGERAAIARSLGLRSLPSLSADLTVRPWMDGVEITGGFHAVVGQICALSLEPFEQPLAAAIDLRAVPAGSPQAPDAEGGEIDYDPDAPDPPDILEGGTIDLAHYVVEHLALEIDPFARKPGAEFDYTPPDEPESPFAVLRKLQDREP